ncbi:MAG: LytR/AlgR family response regulator transcription factor [Cytophagales bacterium]
MIAIFTKMLNGLRDSVFARNAIGMAALLVAYYIPDRFSIIERTGINKLLPYFFLLLMYGWIVFHNRILFEGLYLNGRKRAYLTWFVGGMVVSSVAMHVVLVTQFGQLETLSKIVTFWVFTLTGLGVYVILKFLHLIHTKAEGPDVKAASDVTFFTCTIDGNERQIPLTDLYYVESLENYVKLITKQKNHIVRLSLKEAEKKLPKSFLRISRSHIVNTRHIETHQGNIITLRGERLKIGKVYKRHVEEKLGL